MILIVGNYVILFLLSSASPQAGFFHMCLISETLAYEPDGVNVYISDACKDQWSRANLVDEEQEHERDTRVLCCAQFQQLF